MEKIKKILALIIAVTMLFGISTSYVKAEDEGACDHFGENFDEEWHTNKESWIIDCTYAAPHPCYVMGQPALCQTYHYKIKTAYSCKRCKEFLYYKYSYSELHHQYNHSN